jgi:hypothetical protein
MKGKSEEREVVGHRGDLISGDLGRALVAVFQRLLLPSIATLSHFFVRPLIPSVD